MSQKQNTYADIVNELQRSFEFFVDHFNLDKSKYTNVLITLMASGRRQAYGWHGAGFWEDTGHVKRTEINLSAEYLNRPAEEILGTLLHEMAHLKNSVEGIKDCDPSNQYHNKKFKTSAEFFGLEVSKLGSRGWAKTELGKKAQDAIKALKPNVEVYSVTRISAKRLKEPSKKYIAVFIDESYKEKLETACKALGKNKKEVVEGYLDTF